MISREGSCSKLPVHLVFFNGWSAPKIRPTALRSRVLGPWTTGEQIRLLDELKSNAVSDIVLIVSLGVLLVCLGIVIVRYIFRQELGLEPKPDGRIVFDTATGMSYCRVCKTVVPNREVKCPNCR